MRTLIRHTVAHPVMGILHLAADALDAVRGAALTASVFLTGVADMLHDITSPDEDEDDEDDAEERADFAVGEGAERETFGEPMQCVDCGAVIGRAQTTLTRQQRATAYGIAMEMHRERCRGGRAS